MEGNTSNLNDPNHLHYHGAPVLVNDISVADPLTGHSLTLDGIFGMNLLTGSVDLIPDPLLQWGLRTVDGSHNNIVPGQEQYGAADRIFPRLAPPEFRDAIDRVVPGIVPVAVPLEASTAEQVSAPETRDPNPETR